MAAIQQHQTQWQWISIQLNQIHSKTWMHWHPTDTIQPNKMHSNKWMHRHSTDTTLNSSSRQFQKTISWETHETDTHRTRLNPSTKLNWQKTIELIHHPQSHGNFQNNVENMKLDQLWTNNLCHLDGKTTRDLLKSRIKPIQWLARSHAHPNQCDADNATESTRAHLSLQHHITTSCKLHFISFSFSALLGNTYTKRRDTSNKSASKNVNHPLKN